MGIRDAVLLLGLLAVTSGTKERVHPADGPDADVRIRITNDAVRVNVILNLAFVDAIIEVAREDEFALHESEHAAVKEDVFAYLKSKNSVSIDGVTVAPTLEEFEVTGPEMSLVANFPRMGAKALIKIRFELLYSAKTPPRTASFIWGPFPDDVVTAAPDGTMPPVQVAAQLSVRGKDEVVTFTKDEPEFTWHAPEGPEPELLLAVPEAARRATWSIPLVSVGLWVLTALSMVFGLFTKWGRGHRTQCVLVAAILLAGGFWARGVAHVRVADPFRRSAGVPTAKEAQEIFRPLHANIYRAFDYNEESEIYDALARSVDGKLLEDLYNQIYRSLIMQDQGGAVSKVKEVTLVESNIENLGTSGSEQAPSFQVVARWRVLGEVFHWGHSHTRLNEYQARYTVASSESGWRIAGQKILEQFRVDAAPGELDERDKK